MGFGGGKREDPWEGSPEKASREARSKGWV
jgi:hypothetical protein